MPKTPSESEPASAATRVAEQMVARGAVPTDEHTQYGFTFGPAVVERICHVEGRGRVLRVKTDHAELQVYVSEAGRRIRAYRPGNGELVELRGKPS